MRLYPKPDLEACLEADELDAGAFSFSQKIMLVQHDHAICLKGHAPAGDAGARGDARLRRRGDAADAAGDAAGPAGRAALA